MESDRIANPAHGPTDLWLQAAVSALQRLAQTLPQPHNPVSAQASADTPLPRDQIEHLVVQCLAFEAFCAVLLTGAAVPLGLSDGSERRSDLFLSLRDSHPFEICQTTSKLLASLQEAHRGSGTLADQVKCHIDGAYRAPNTLKSLGRHFGVTPRALSAAFLKRFGKGVRQYLTELRVRHGLTLVRSGTKIEAVAYDVGYKSKKDFYRAVRMVTGVTPGSLRAGPRNINIRMTSELANVSSLITDDHGDPPSSCLVFLFGQAIGGSHDMSHLLSVSRCDRDGRLEAGSLPLGDYDVVVLDYLGARAASLKHLVEHVRDCSAKVSFRDGIVTTIKVQVS